LQWIFEMSEPPNQDRPPGKGFLGWLGRQVAHVAKAVKTDVSPEASKTVYRDCKIEEQPLPDDPRVKLRRTVIDEVIVEKKRQSDKKQ
jgi:hypothetical protein